MTWRWFWCALRSPPRPWPRVPRQEVQANLANAGLTPPRGSAVSSRAQRARRTIVPSSNMRVEGRLVEPQVRTPGCEPTRVHRARSEQARPSPSIPTSRAHPTFGPRYMIQPVVPSSTSSISTPATPLSLGVVDRRPFAIRQHGPDPSPPPSQHGDRAGSADGFGCKDIATSLGRRGHPFISWTTRKHLDPFRDPTLSGNWSGRQRRVF